MTIIKATSQLHGSDPYKSGDKKKVDSEFRIKEHSKNSAKNPISFGAAEVLFKAIVLGVGVGASIFAKSDDFKEHVPYRCRSQR